jgi:hypothetical protein
MIPLYGGGLVAATLQIGAIYFGISLTVHYLIPALIPVSSIQVQPRRKNQVLLECLHCLGARPPPAIDLPELYTFPWELPGAYIALCDTLNSTPAATQQGSHSYSNKWR